jgi:hypothetical protein
MNQTPTRVTVVVERNFVGSLEELAQHTDVWIVDTPNNRAGAENLWAHRTAYSSHTVTTFHAELSLSPEMWVIALLPSLDDHHGLHEEWASDVELQVVGISATANVQAALREFGAFVIEQNNDGFTARRKPAV